jgi:muramoyltetrapeptide carboxypeptidase
MRIAVVAPSAVLQPDVADRVVALAAEHHPDVSVTFHPQCFLTYNHFAGTDTERLAALIEVANDPSIDVVWFARGGYGACRIAEDALDAMEEAARSKTFIGYSDAGFLLAGLYRRGIGRAVHGPMPADIRREGGEATVLRTLAWLTGGDRDALEPGLNRQGKAAAFNITVLSHLLGTPLQPDLADHELLLEDVSEYTYRTDRAMFHITAHPAVRGVAGIRLGRCSLVPENDPDFGESEADVVRHWCERANIRFLGDADIGHDAANRIVPFGHQSR